ncbi:MAG: NUDIX domain-containing protein [Candidatus Uhrbacteria bacterium]|nr:NUDIX domain-containing protein [Candidatus Uhrbacteria bacterium]
MNELPRAIVSAILFQKQEEEVKIFLQTRQKPTVSPMYSGMIEIPAGCIDSYENVYDALKREVKEETNLDFVRIVDDYQGETIQPRAGDRAFVFKPFVCQQALETNSGLPWIGFVFLCEVKGEVKNDLTEAKDPRWVSIKELTEIVENNAENIFPLQLPVFKYLLENAGQIRF